MAIYFVTFVLSSMFVEAAGRARSTIARLAMLAPAVIITSVVAGARDLHVGGPDAAAYGEPVFSTAAQARTIGELVFGAAPIYSAGEQGYIGLNFLISRFTSDVHVYLFVLAALTAGIVLSAIMLVRCHGSTGLMWLTFLCTSYVDTFNLVRQGPTLALALLGIALTIRRHALAGLLVGVSGVLFHTSAVIFVPMWAITIYLMRDRPRPGRRAAFVVAASAAALFVGAPYINLIAGFAGGRFAAYLTAGADAGAAVGLDALYRLVPLVAAVFAYRSLARTGDDTPSPVTGGPPAPPSGQGGVLTAAVPTRSATLARRTALLVLTALMAIELVMIPLREISYPLYRVPLYFGYVKILAYAMTVHTFRQHRWLAALGLIGFVTAYFVLVVVQRNDGAYSSEILGILAG